jgi:Pentapeptide repeats (9 copies)
LAANPTNYGDCIVQDPYNITKEELINLVKAGKNTFNSWSRLRQTANFAQWDFDEMQITGLNFFEFFGGARFDAAVFGDGTEFQHAKFHGHVYFTNSIFLGNATFSSANFGTQADFTGAQFRNKASFNDSRFQTAIFRGAQFASTVNFNNAVFEWQAIFDATEWRYLASREDIEPQEFYKALNRRLEKIREWAEPRDITPKTFRKISFSGARFGRFATFEGRQFEAKTDFGCSGPIGQPFCFRDWIRHKYRARKTHDYQYFKGRSEIGSDLDRDVKEPMFSWLRRLLKMRKFRSTIFEGAPVFHNCKLYVDTSFDDAIFPAATGNLDAARAYRTLKIAFSQQQAIKEEQRFFKLELAEEAKRIPLYLPRRWLFGAFWLFSNYGFGVWLPFVWWLICICSFAGIYSQMAGAPNSVLWQHFSGSPLEFSLLHSLPLPGLEKFSTLSSTQFHFSNSVVLLQKAISFTLLFLIGLGLRNLFKMK